MNDIEQAIQFSRSLLKNKKVYRSPILYIGKDSYEEFLDTRYTHAWTLKLCVYVPNLDDLYEYVNLKGLGVHIESFISPLELEPIISHFMNCGAKAVFCTDLNTKQTVFFSEEVKDAA